MRPWPLVNASSLAPLFSMVGGIGFEPMAYCV